MRETVDAKRKRARTMLRLWASYQMYIADCKAVLRLLREGAEIEHGEMMLNREATEVVIPQPLVVGRGEDPVSVRIQRLMLLHALLDGSDLAALKRLHAPRALWRKRKANLKLYRKILKSLRSDVKRGVDLILEGYRQHNDFSKLDELVPAHLRAILYLLGLCLAALLYWAHLPGAQKIISKCLFALLPLLDILGGPPTDLVPVDQ